MNAMPAVDPAVVILTGGEHLSVLAAARALRAAGYAPWVTVHERGTYAARSRAVAGIIDIPSPWDDERGFVDGIVEATERTRAAVVVPGTEFGMDTLARHAAELPPGVVLGMGPPSALDNATDKGRLGEHARAAGLSVPPGLDLSLAAVPENLPFPFPVVVKPHRSELLGQDGVVRHYGAHHATSMSDIRAALEALPGERGLVQPFLVGPLVSLAGVFWDGRMVCAVQSRADRLWPSRCGSISHAVTVPLDAGLSQSVADLLQAVGWQGLFQVDLFERRGSYTIIDLNPRFYTSLSHATRAGMNLPAIWVDLLLGRVPAVPSTYRTGVHYRHDEGDLRALAQKLARGPRLDGLRGLIPHGDTALAVFSVNDPGPVVTSIARLVRHFVRRRDTERRASGVLREERNASPGHASSARAHPAAATRQGPVTPAS